ncbi:hypothetical protein K8I31_21880 [bacterium]|nr:hypothetical protein [bacterium]
MDIDLAGIWYGYGYAHLNCEVLEMPIFLPATTLCCVDCQNAVPALRSLERSMRQCLFERVIFFTDSVPSQIPSGIEVVTIPKIANKSDYSFFMIKTLGEYIETDFALITQWDGFVIDGSKWRDSFFEYDYIGAKWWYDDAYNVGNGGFSFRSKRLMNALQDPRISEFEPEDAVVGRVYRNFLEEMYQIRYATSQVAEQFAFERIFDHVETFGFHGAYHLWRFLSDDELTSLLEELDASVFAYPEMLVLAKNCFQESRYECARIIAEKILSFVPYSVEAYDLLQELKKKWL